MKRPFPFPKSLIATCVCVVVGCGCGYAVWHYTVWNVYFAKSGAEPLPFENFGEITRVFGIALGGVTGLVCKEIISFIVSKSRATPIRSQQSE